MAIDLRQVAPAELVRLLNSTPLGEVLTERRLYRHRQLAGLRIGDGRNIHLPRYVAWLIERLDGQTEFDDVAKKQSHLEKRQRQYEQHRRSAAARQALIAEVGQEIGAPPPVSDPQRRERCRRDFRKFCEEYFPEIFYLPWSADQLKVIAKIERAVLAGELFAFAMPRGDGKTSLCLAAVVWATLCGHHLFVTLIAATEYRARKLLEKVYNVLERNDRLFGDFPEICHPIRKLERTPQRTHKQKSSGRYTSMTWTRNEIVLPTIAGSAASGATITVCGLTGGDVRGQIKDMPDGRFVRPSLVLVDDPQTRASARSRTQTDERMELLLGDVLGMAGPDRKIAGILPCTVIMPGDLADQILDTAKHPEWHGERMAMVYAWPKNEKLWEEYASLRADGLRRNDGGAKATEFYRGNRAAMDAGSKVAWEHRFPPDCISAIQHAMNLKLADEAAFFAEYQNAPLSDQAELEVLTVEQISEKINRRPQAKIPTACSKLVLYIDVHKKLLYFTAIAFEPNFTGYVVDYGAYPDPKRQHYSMREIRRTLMGVHRGKGEEAAIYAGLETLAAEKIGKPFFRDDGAAMRINLCLIDSGYKKDPVELFCRQSKYAPIILSAKGFPVTASSVPLDERPRKRGEEVGDNWRITGSQGAYSVRLALIDTNFWKSFLHARLAVAVGDAGCLSIFGKAESAHRLFAEHLTAEQPVKTEGRGRKLEEWKVPAHKPDNHFLDCAAGCMAGASILGVRLLRPAVPKARQIKPRKIKARYFNRGNRGAA
jgi:hypothetical protein